MSNSFVLDPEFKSFISSYRIGSPVRVHGEKTFITGTPVEGIASINGYKVFKNSTNIPPEDITPIPLDEEFLSRHENLFFEEGSVYECNHNHHIVTVTPDGQCSIDGEYYGIIHRHELKAILEFVCGITIPLFDDISGDNEDSFSPQ